MTTGRPGRAWLGYVGAALPALAAGVGIGILVTGREAWTELVLAAGIAWMAQAAAFGVLVRAGGTDQDFLKAWAIGMALRAGVVVIVGVGLLQSGSFRPAPLLLGTIVFLFGLVMLEPPFLRAARQIDERD